MAEISALIKVLFRGYLVLSYLFLHWFMLLSMSFTTYITIKVLYTRQFNTKSVLFYFFAMNCWYVSNYDEINSLAPGNH